MSEYQVVPMGLLMEWPSSWAAGYEQKLADALTVAMEKKSAEGWELVSTFAHPQHGGPGYAIFRRPAGVHPPKPLP
jgi:hypothetical protein